MVLKDSTQVRYFQVDKRNIAFISFIFEGYEHIAIVSTCRKTESPTIKVSFSPCFTATVEAIIRDLQKEFSMKELQRPI